MPPTPFYRASATPGPHQTSWPLRTTSSTDTLSNAFGSGLSGLEEVEGLGDLFLVGAASSGDMPPPMSSVQVIGWGLAAFVVTAMFVSTVRGFR